MGRFIRAAKFVARSFLCCKKKTTTPTIPPSEEPYVPTEEKALLVGINAYPGAPLNGCVNDVEDIAQFLVIQHGFKEENIRMLVDGRATTSAILERLEWLAATKEGGKAYFHYSGHGAQIPSRNGDGEVDNQLEVICVGEDMHIATDHGLLQAKRVHELVQQGYPIKTKVNNKFYRISDSAKSRKDSEIEVKLSTSTTLRVGEEHPIFVFDNGIVRQVKGKNLRPGDQILRSSAFFKAGTEYDEVWYLVGLFIGDGYFLGGNVVKFGVRSYVDQWLKVIDIFKRNFDDVKAYHHFYNRKGSEKKDLSIRINSRKFTTLLRSLGFNPGRKTGNINELSLPFEEKCLRGFVRGYFDADGSSSKSTIRFSSVDKELINLVDTILNYFGIKGNRNEIIRKNPRHNKVYSYVCNHANAKRYVEAIGFNFLEKNKLSNRTMTRSGDKDGVDLSSLVRMIDKYNLRWCDFTRVLGLKPRSYTRLRNKIFRSDQILNLVGVLQEKVEAAHEIIDGNSSRRLEIGASIGNIENINGTSSFSVFNRLEKGNTSDLNTYAEKMINELEPILTRPWNILKNYNLVKIDTVRTITNPVEMYDFTVEGEAKFEINGVLVHNCPVDFDWSEAHMITDKQFVEIFKKMPSGVHFNWLSDSCHSGDLDRFMPRAGDETNPVRLLGIRRYPIPRDMAWRQRVARTMKLERAMVGNQLDVGFMSGCKSDQTSADAEIGGRPCGAFTHYFLEAWKQSGSPYSTKMSDLCAKTSSLLAGSGFRQEPTCSGSRAELPLFG